MDHERWKRGRTFSQCKKRGSGALSHIQFLTYSAIEEQKGKKKNHKQS